MICRQHQQTKSPANNFQQVVVKPQAATALNINAGESLGKQSNPKQRLFLTVTEVHPLIKVAFHQRKDRVIMIPYTLERK